MFPASGFKSLPEVSLFLSNVCFGKTWNPGLYFCVFDSWNNFFSFYFIKVYRNSLLPFINEEQLNLKPVVKYG